MKACVACRFYCPLPAGAPDGDRGQCRRNAPAVLNKGSHPDREQLKVSFPIVCATDWCGAFEPRTAGEYYLSDAQREYLLEQAARV